MKKYVPCMLLIAALFTGCGGDKGLSQKDRAYYHDALAAGVRPTVTAATEQAIADSLFGPADINAVMVKRVQSAYAGNIAASAERISSLDPTGINPEIVAMAGDIKIARLRQLSVLPEIREPDVSGAALEFLGKLLFNQINSKDARESDARMRELFQSSIQAAGTFASNYTRSVEAYAQLEKTILERPTACMERLGSPLAVNLPPLSQICGEIILEQEARCTKARKALDAAALYRTFIGQQHQGYNFEPGEMTDLKVLTQETKGHCFVSDIEISLVGTRSKKKFSFKLKTVHAVHVDGSCSLIFMK